MKGLEQFTDAIAIGIGMLGALMKGLKQRVKTRTLLISMCIAGILTYSITGAIEIFYDHLTPKLIILISFVVGWGANELTEKIDLLIDDIYEYFSNKLKPKKDEPNENR